MVRVCLQEIKKQLKASIYTKKMTDGLSVQLMALIALKCKKKWCFGVDRDEIEGKCIDFFLKHWKSIDPDKAPLQYCNVAIERIYISYFRKKLRRQEMFEQRCSELEQKTSVVSKEFINSETNATIRELKEDKQFLLDAFARESARFRHKIIEIDNEIYRLQRLSQEFNSQGKIKKTYRKRKKKR